jgi:hypothetical protein
LNHFQSYFQNTKSTQIFCVWFFHLATSRMSLKLAAATSQLMRAVPMARVSYQAKGKRFKLNFAFRHLLRAALCGTEQQIRTTK